MGWLSTEELVISQISVVPWSGSSVIGSINSAPSRSILGRPNSSKLSTRDSCRLIVAWLSGIRGTEANVWGKTSPWVALRGTVTDAGGPKDVTIAILAHPKGLNSPPYWHARAYGLFAVNPFGRRGYDPKAPERVTEVAVGQRLHMRFRVAVYAGKVDKARLDQDYTAFSQ